VAVGVGGNGVAVGSVGVNAAQDEKKNALNKRTVKNFFIYLPSPSAKLELLYR
jgi:hypothetical protein